MLIYMYPYISKYIYMHICLNYISLYIYIMSSNYQKTIKNR